LPSGTANPIGDWLLAIGETVPSNRRYGFTIVKSKNNEKLEILLEFSEKRDTFSMLTLDGWMRVEEIGWTIPLSVWRIVASSGG